MESDSIGALLRLTRETHKISIAQVANETHISARFLEALEEDRFEEFDSETYLIGFLRTYANYLSLDGQQVVERYRYLKVQEQPTPIQELLTHKRRKVWPVVVLSLLGVATIALVVVGISIGIGSGGAAAGAGGSGAGEQVPLLERIFANRTIGGGESRRAQRRAAEQSAGNRYVLRDGYLERQLSDGDTIAVDVKTAAGTESQHVLSVGKIRRTLALVVDTEPSRVRLGEASEYDLNFDGSADITVLVREIFRDSTPPRALIRVTEINSRGNGTAAAAQSADATESETATGFAEEGSAEYVQLYGETLIASRRRSPVPLGGGAFPGNTPISAQITFTSTVYLQYQIDGAGDPIAQLYSPGQTVSVRADNSLRVWTTNAGATNLQIAGQPIELGEAGQVQTIVVEKGEDGDGNAVIRLAPLY